MDFDELVEAAISYFSVNSSKHTYNAPYVYLDVLLQDILNCGVAIKDGGDFARIPGSSFCTKYIWFHKSTSPSLQTPDDISDNQYRSLFPKHHLIHQTTNNRTIP